MQYGCIQNHGRGRERLKHARQGRACGFAPAAKAIRARYFTDGAEPKRARASRASVGLWPAVASVSGAAIGAPLGWVVRGSALMAGKAGAAPALCGLLLALAFSVSRVSEPTVQQSSAQTSTTVARRRSEGRERKP